MIYYINVLYFYSLIGFIIESDIFKIKNSHLHSGIFYGPITEVYGFGIITLILLKKHFLDKLKCNKYLKLFLTFITSCISLTLIEYIGGNTLHLIFGINMWNYTNKPLNFGKYICLELSIIWGFLGCFLVYYGLNFLDRFIKQIPKKLTYIFIIINIIDTIATLLTK